MKKIIFTLAFVVAACVSSYAQTQNTPACWVIEGSKNSNLQTIKFYNENQQLVYEEIISTKLNINKKKTQQALNMILANLLNKDGYVANKNIVAASFHTAR